MSLSAVESVNPDEWDNFLGQCPQALIFHLNEWLEILSDTQQSALRRFGFVSESGPHELVGIMPLFFKRFGPFRVAGSPLVVEDTPYMGPALRKDRLPDALLAIRDKIKRETSFLRVLVPYSVSVVGRQTLEAAGFTVIRKTTHRLDLSVGADTIWKRMEGRCRTAIRRAERAGVEVHRVTDVDTADIVRYYALVAQVYGHQGRRTPNPFRFYEALWERLGASGLLSLMMARVDGRDIAGGLFAHDDRDMYYLDGASDREYRKLNAGNLVLWRALQWAAEQGKSEFDFVGSDIPRLARFKASFGGELIEHSCIEWARSKSVWLARAWYANRGKHLLSKVRLGLVRPAPTS